MHKDIDFSLEEFFLHHKKMYSFLRENWDIKTISILKNILRKFINSCDASKLADMEREIRADIRTAIIAVDEVGLKQSSVLAILLIHPVSDGNYTIEKCRNTFGEETATILKGLIKIA